MTNKLQVLKAKLEQGSLPLDASTIGSDLANRLQRAFSSKDALTLEKTEIIAETDDALHFQARVTSLLGVMFQAIEGMFFVVGDQLHCLLKATLPSIWDFSWSYPDLPDYPFFGLSEAGSKPSFFYDLRFPDGKPMVLVFSSYDFQKDKQPSAYIKQLDDNLDAAKIHRGLNFIGEIDLAKIYLLGVLIEFAKSCSEDKEFGVLPFYGHLHQDFGYEEIRLEIDLPLTHKEDIFSFGISHLVLHTSTSLYADYTGSGISFIGEINIGGDAQQPPHNVEFLWPIGSTQLIVRNAEPIPFPGFDTFKTLLDDHLPKDDFLLVLNFADLQIREFCLHLSLSSPPISHIALSVGPDQNWQQTLLGEVLSIEDVELRWEVNPGSSNPIHFYVLTCFKVGGGLVNASAVFPDFVFSGELGLYQTVKLDSIIKQIIPDAKLPTLPVLDLAISADIKQSLYAFEIDLASDWTLQLGESTILPLKYIRLELEHNPAGNFATINSVMTLAGVDIILFASNMNESNGWEFSGSTRRGQQIPIGHLATDFEAIFGIQENPVPSIETLVIENIATRFNTEDKHFYFTCEALIEIEEQTIDAVLQIETTHNQTNKTNKIEIKGHVAIGNLQFDLKFDQTNNKSKSQSFIATYSHHGDAPIPLNALAENITTDETLLTLVKGIQLNLKNALFAYNKTPAGTKVLFGLDIGTGIKLSQLPVVGKLLPPELSVSIDDLCVLIACQAFTHAEIESFNALADTSFKIPESAATDTQQTALAKGLKVSAKLQLGGVPQDLGLPVSSPGQPALPDPTSPSTPTPSIPTAYTSATTTDNATWLNLHRNLGPVRIERVGMQYKDATLSFLLDAALTVGGLTLSLQGLEVGYPLNKFDPKFNLRGLGLDYKNGPVEIGGAFLKGKITFEGKEYDDYSGMVIIRAKLLTLAAMGSYVELNVGPSLFVYAALSYPIGGPAFFFVTGLAAGFGYNRLLHVPPVDQIHTFPLVAEALGTSKASDLAGELGKLQSYIPPSVGNYFLAAGIRFATFKMIDSFVLLSASFGHRFELDVVGLSAVVLPSPETAKAVPIAEVQLALRAAFAPEDGVLQIAAQLTENSFLLDRKCHLTGGLVFSAWFAGSQAGDFVLTAGGYHPKFSPPSHYPTAPRLGLNWQVSDQLSFKGGAYFALTPSLLMAGCGLSADWQAGNLHAWFYAGLDFTISWKPYHYAADFRVSVGASYTFELFGSRQITAQLDADMSIWGPEFAGVAHVNWYVISFDIEFGKSNRKPLEPITWDQFEKSFLPKPEQICTITLKEGLLVRSAKKDAKTQNGAAQNQNDLGVVNPQTLCLATDSVIPVKQVFLGENKQPETISKPAIKAFNIGTMQVSDGQITSVQRIKVTRDNQPISPEDYFEFQALTKNAPTALWGDKLQPSLSDPPLVANLLTGFEIRAKRRTESAVVEMGYETGATTIHEVPDAFCWSVMAAYTAQVYNDDKARKRIDDTLDAESVTAKRDALAKALFDGIRLDLNGFKADEFLSAPQVN